MRVFPGARRRAQGVVHREACINQEQVKRLRVHFVEDGLHA